MGSGRKDCGFVLHDSRVLVAEQSRDATISFPRLDRDFRLDTPIAGQAIWEARLASPFSFCVNAL